MVKRSGIGTEGRGDEFASLSGRADSDSLEENSVLSKFLHRHLLN
jgi:hypothetical protein